MAPLMLDLVRFGLMADLALLMGLPLFWWTMGMAGRRDVLAVLAVGGAAFSGLWLIASAATMTGTRITSPDWATIQILLTMTPIGMVLAARFGALALVLVAILLSRGHRVALIPATAAAATLAWTGHAGATEGLSGTIHRAADVAHVWAAAGWIGALAVLLHALTVRGQEARQVAGMLARFAGMGTAFVAVLVITGLVNVGIIVGWDDLPALAGSRYGWLLMTKLALFTTMLALAATNRWRLTPALERSAGDTSAAIAHLRLSLAVETAAALAILGLVALLGTLDPLA
ncbi:MAG: copper homeostasis membrane protein CopD [Sphingobium sp.]